MPFEKRKHLELLRARLNALASRFGQAEIARRTDTPAANVHRYLREGKVPVEFCAALVSEFQVSPIWLIEGHGGMLRSEVRKPIADMGGDLLELVETMNAVSRMRIGAVAGQHDRKTLRELSESMDAFDRLREKLNVHTRPLLSGVLEELGEAIDRMDMDHAATLLLTAHQLSRLTTDEELLERLDSHEGGYSYLAGQLDRAIAAERKVFARRMRDGHIKKPEDLVKARNLAMSVRDAGRLKEARRIVRAGLDLAGDDCVGTPIMYQMQVFEAHLDTDLGELRAALGKAARAYPYIRDDHFFSGITYSYMQLIAGMWTFPETVQFGRMSSGKARVVTRFAATVEDADCLGICLPALVGSPPERLPEDEYDTALAQLVLDLLRRRKRRVSDYDALLGKYPPRIPSPFLREVMVHLHRAQIARLCGDSAILRKESAACEAAWLSLSSELSAKLEWLLTHRRNLRGIPSKQRTRVHRDALARVSSEVGTHVANGYRYLDVS
ncbi:MAG: hypothetical protein K8I27_13805 [Planctomycetes bacterium]|nr:hypothetical protein [Planctomycetota bacterium]